MTGSISAVDEAGHNLANAVSSATEARSGGAGVHAGRLDTSLVDEYQDLVGDNLRSSSFHRSGALKTRRVRERGML
jgi:hypothetical protein